MATIRYKKRGNKWTDKCFYNKFIEFFKQGPKFKRRKISNKTSYPNGGTNPLLGDPKASSDL